MDDVLLLCTSFPDFSRKKAAKILMTATQFRAAAKRNYVIGISSKHGFRGSFQSF